MEEGGERISANCKRVFVQKKRVEVFERELQNIDGPVL